MPKVAVVLGSKSDLGATTELRAVLLQLKIEFDLSVISAHRNPRDLHDYCETMMKAGVLVFVGVAGKSAALPGAIAAYIGSRRPVIAVPLDSKPFGPMDALLSCVSMPPGVPVNVVADPKNAGIAVAQILAIGDEDLWKDLCTYIESNRKPPERGINREEK
jgi:5-(carboxyamino)imidazole ribonucleotide mutase